MPVVDENRLKGNWGALRVANRLAGLCLVRPVPGDTDVAIDLFCESVADEQPFLHFWIQVKTGSQCKVDEENGEASCSFTTDHLRYWSRQPVPVYAALVPSDPSVTQEPDIYIIDMTELLLESPIKSGQDTQTLTSQYVWRSGDRDGVRAFLETQLPTSTALLRIRDGVLSPIPSLDERYFNIMPMVPILTFCNTILTQLRRTAACSILSLKVSRQYGDETAPFRRRLARVLAQFDDDLHWETHAARAFSHHLDGEYAPAAIQYRQALEIIKRDPNTKGLPEWERRAKELRADCGRSERQEALAVPDRA